MYVSICKCYALFVKIYINKWTFSNKQIFFNLTIAAFTNNFLKVIFEQWLKWLSRNLKAIWNDPKSLGYFLVIEKTSGNKNFVIIKNMVITFQDF